MVRSKNRRKKGVSLTLVGLGLTAIMCIVLISYLSGLDRGGPPFPFEEIYARSRQLSGYICLIDKAISDGFYEIGVPQEKIIFLSVLPRHKGGYNWDFNSIEARIPQPHSIFQIGREIRNRISSLGIPVQIKTDKKSGNEIIYNIYYRDFYTHKLRIILDTCEHPHRLTYPKIGIIIDDLGYDSSLAKAFIEFDLPLTFSVLPFAPSARSIARKARKEGRETMLHLPMEPINYPAINPGDGVLLVSMDKEMILEILNRDLSQVPFVAGVNNHMGSRFTENEEKMAVVLGALKTRDLYFIDSRTSGNSVAFEAAKEMALRTACRDIFLDNDLSDDALKVQVERLLSLARHKGRAIGIGHPHEETLMFLKKYQSTINNEAEVVPVSNLVN
ncbi:MAG: divergent polysaccharide deacetylase family protein [Deltaproteobacteria bacterium]|nr:MAG: divergent polysaccharide deacetylase family protein [Deltaproteobacteria bacterium]